MKLHFYCLFHIMRRVIDREIRKLISVQVHNVSVNEFLPQALGLWVATSLQVTNFQMVGVAQFLVLARVFHLGYG